MKFKVWDELNESEAEAIEADACNSYEAATMYAKDDTDGDIDGVYAGSGHVLCVRDVRGCLRRCLVTVEYSPSYYAVPAPLTPPEPSP